jgi:hypothetical protein
METLVERCAGLDVHKGSVTACVRCPTAIVGATPRPAGSPRPPPGWGYWPSGWPALGDRGGDGVDRLLLEAGLAAAGGPGGVLAAQRGPPAQRPWA